MIYHLSFPHRDSLNDQIDPELASVSYTSFNKAISVLQRLGPNAFLAKEDIQSAFWLLPIHLSSFNSLGIYFNNNFFIDKCLPMGCSLSCVYFKTFSTFLEWFVSYTTGSNNLIHYLDDFLFMGPERLAECDDLLSAFQEVCRVFGVPLAMEKTMGVIYER